jgi:hypothetical protein
VIRYKVFVDGEDDLTSNRPAEKGFNTEKHVGGTEGHGGRARKGAEAQRKNATWANIIYPPERSGGLFTTYLEDYAEQGEL